MIPGELYWVDLCGYDGYLAAVIQDGEYAGGAPTVLAVPLADRPGPAGVPGVVPVAPSPGNGLEGNMFAMVCQLCVIERVQLRERSGQLGPGVLGQIRDELSRLTGRSSPVPAPAERARPSDEVGRYPGVFRNGVVIPTSACRWRTEPRSRSSRARSRSPHMA